MEIPIINRSKQRIDMILLSAVLLLIGLGVAFNYGASANLSMKLYNNPSALFLRQLIFALFSLSVMAVVVKINPDIYSKSTKLLVLTTIAFLLLVLVLGREIKGAKRWISFGLVHFEPSEFAKVVLVIYLANILDKKKDKIQNLVKGFIAPLVIVLIIAFIIVLQKDLSTSIIILLIAINIFVLAGTPARFLLYFGLVTVPAIGIVIANFPHSRTRISSYILQMIEQESSNIQMKKSITAIKSGGLFGKGIGKLDMNIPDSHNDFIYPTIIYNAGLLVGLAILCLFVIIGVRGYRLTYMLRETKPFLSLVAFGLTSYILWQAVINLSMVLGIIPTTGVPLPFLSYGGSSLLSLSITVGIILSISKLTSEETQPEKRNIRTDKKS